MAAFSCRGNVYAWAHIAIFHQVDLWQGFAHPNRGALAYKLLVLSYLAEVSML
jgi:hypothetical protein